MAQAAIVGGETLAQVAIKLANRLREISII